MVLTLTAINRYPFKSCRGQELTAAAVEPWGLAGDRRWMVVDSAGAVVTAREHPRLVLVRPELTESGLRLTGPDASDLVVPVPDGRSLVDVSVFRGPFSAALAAEAGHEWFSKVVGEPVRLVYLDDPTRRSPNPLYSKESDRVSLADGYPLLLATEESLKAVNDLIAAGRHAHEGPLPMTRFRPNVVLRGAAAWAEDRWRRVRIGAVDFRVVKGCDRCVLTLVHPDTAARGKEPIATLSQHRKWDGKIWFGMNLIPDTPGATITIGAKVEILETSQGPPH
ncbi:MAG: MOSC domain-containing protein [Jatrophihabitantaceae bacterium]